MAVRYRKGRASPWQCYWNNPYTGKRECANFRAKEEAEKHDSLIKHRLRFERESFRTEEDEEENAPDSRQLTLEACYILYLKQKQFTKKGMSWQMDAMRQPLKSLGATPIDKIGRMQLQNIMDEMGKANVKPVTVRARMSVLRTVLRWAAAQGYREPVDCPILPPAHYERFVPPTPEELAAILQSAPSHIVRVVILGAQCGVRVGPCELFRLTWNDVDLHQRILHVHGAKKNPHAIWREVPIRESLLPVFSGWQQEDARMGMEYIIHYRGKPVNKIQTAWDETLRRAGITRRIRPYDLRHAFATEAIAAGVDIGTVARLMGHSSPSMILMHYQYVMDGQKRAAVEALPDLHMCPKTCAQQISPNEITS